MKVAAIHNNNDVKFDKYLVDILINEKDTVEAKERETPQSKDWENIILNEGLNKLENSIQNLEDNSPLSYKNAPSINSLDDANKVLREINSQDLIENFDSIFSNLNIGNISSLFMSDTNEQI